MRSFPRHLLRDSQSVKINFVHICDYASVSREGKLSTMGIFDTIHVQSLPAMHPLLYLAYEIEMRPAEVGQNFKLGIKLVDADGKVMMQTEAQATAGAVAPLQAGSVLKIPQLLALGGMPLPRAGRYSFDIFINDDHKTAATFDVVMGGGPVAGTPGGPALPP